MTLFHQNYVRCIMHVSADDAVKMIKKIGPNCHLAKAVF